MKKLNVIFFIAIIGLFHVLSNMAYAKPHQPALKNTIFNNKTDFKLNVQPKWLNVVSSRFYDADENDLVTAGYGFSALSGGKIPVELEKLDDNLSTETLRKYKLNRAIDRRSGEGYFYGFRFSDLTPLFDGKIAGTEVLAYLAYGDEKVTFLLQVPLDFDVKKPCVVAVPTMDFEGVYNAKDLQIRGLWGLKHNCAVVYNDKGLGNFLFEMDSKRGYLVNGKTAQFYQGQDDNGMMFVPETSASSKVKPYRYASKMSHSKQNSEAKWGEYVLNSIEFALYQLNDMFSPTREVIIVPDNTTILVYGASDGGGAALKAGEFDKNNIIDGIVAVNPQIQVNPNLASLAIQHGDNEQQPLQVKPFIEYSTYAGLYIPCAAYSLKKVDVNYTMPYLDKFYYAENRCNALKAQNLLTKETTEAQSQEALDKLYQAGWSSAMVAQLPYYYFMRLPQLPYQYISAYGRFGVDESLCDFSIASVNQEFLYNRGTVEPLDKVKFSSLWINNTGLLPVQLDRDNVAIDLVNDADPNGPRRNFYSQSVNGNNIDYNLAGEQCLIRMISSQRVQRGLAESYATGQLNQTKAIVVQGQLDVVHLPDYSSRAYVALNSFQEGSLSNLRYLEVENAGYWDGSLPFDNRLVAIDYYGEKAMDMLWANITKKASLPDSQIIKTQARGDRMGRAPMVTKNSLVPVLQSSKKNHRIIAQDGTIYLPE